MAKSIRSKWKRKMRAVKRERYGKKELERLKKTLGVEGSQAGTSGTTEGKLDDSLSEIVSFTTADEIKEKQKEQEMDVIDQEELEEIQKFNPKTLRNEKGAYPVWVHPRKIKKVKKEKKKKAKGKVTKKTKKK